jgi:hypothetical protein
MKKLTDILNEIKINNPLAVAARDRASKEQEMDEIKINQPDPKRPPSLLEVIKDRYLCTGRTREGDYHTKDEIFDNFAHLFVVGDIWKLIKNEDDEYCYECIKGQWEEDVSEGWWEYNDTTKDFFKVLKP